MAMRTATPFWLAWAHLGALLVLFVAQRFLDPWPTLRTGAMVKADASGSMASPAWGTSTTTGDSGPEGEMTSNGSQLALTGVDP